MNSEKTSQRFPMRSVVIIGYSQSGKSTRARCIAKHFKKLITEEDHPDIEIRLKNVTTQTRHITFTKLKLTISESGEINLIYLDYTGQDHQAAYYILKEINRMIDTISDDDMKSKVFNEIKNIADKVAEIFKRRHQEKSKGLDKDTFKEIILDPFKPFKEVITGVNNTYTSVLKTMLSIYGGPKFDKYEDLRSELENVLNEIEFDKLTEGGVNESVLNRILCRIDSISPENRDKLETLCPSQGTILIEQGRSNYWRSAITGPLLAYLLLGFLIESNIVIILVPVNTNEWYKKLLKVHGLELNNKRVIDEMKKYVFLDNEIKSRVVDFCSRLIDRYMIEKNYVQKFSSKRGLIDQIREICDLIVQYNLNELEKHISGLQNNMDNDTFNVVKDIWNYIINNSILLWGEAVGRVYHYSLVNILLSLYRKYREAIKDHSLETHIIFSLTYCERDGKDSREPLEYHEALRMVLEPIGTWSSHQKPIPIEIELSNILNTLSRINGVNIYFVPSTIEGSIASVECTPFESLLIACLSGDRNYYEIEYKYLNERRRVYCEALKRETKYNQVIEKLAKQQKSQ